MNGRIVARVLFAVLLLGLLVGMGAYIYNLGVAQGTAVNVQLPAAAQNVQGAPVPYYPYYYGPFWFHPWGFGFVGCLFPILGLFLIFALFRLVFFRGMGGWRGWGSRGSWEHEVPPQVEEWHRRMHEKVDDEPPSSSPG